MGLHVPFLQAHQRVEEAHVDQVRPEELGEGVEVGGLEVAAKRPQNGQEEEEEEVEAGEA